LFTAVFKKYFDGYNKIQLITVLSIQQKIIRHEKKPILRKFKEALMLDLAKVLRYLS
jgi:hypothetical protein